jgi:hypothetical protein
LELANEEIKAVAIPYQNKIFNLAVRFKRKMDSLEFSFEIDFRNHSQAYHYIATGRTIWPI